MRVTESMYTQPVRVSPAYLLSRMISACPSFKADGLKLPQLVYPFRGAKGAVCLELAFKITRSRVDIVLYD